MMSDTVSGPSEAPTTAQILESLSNTYRPEGVYLWLVGRHRLLGGRRPVDLLDTPEGRREVYAQARALEEGVFV